MLGHQPNRLPGDHATSTDMRVTEMAAHVTPPETFNVVGMLCLPLTGQVVDRRTQHSEQRGAVPARLRKRWQDHDGTWAS